MTFVCPVCDRDLRGQEMYNPPGTEVVVCVNANECHQRHREIRVRLGFVKETTSDSSKGAK